MRSSIVAAAISIAVLGTAVTARADNGPSHKCYGQIVSGIASTWPWAHDKDQTFEPSPGSVALWIKIFGERAGIKNVRQLQLYFCSG